MTYKTAYWDSETQTLIDRDCTPEEVADIEARKVRPSPVPQIAAAIKAERDRRKFNGVKIGTKWIHTDTYSRTQWMGMVMMGANLPAIDWATMDGSSITTTPTLAGQVFQGTAQLDAALFAYAKALTAQVEASTDPESIDITTGWPATFGE